MAKPRLQKKYQDEIIPVMKKAFGYINPLSVPHLQKVTVNVGAGQGLQDDKFIDMVIDTLRRITGQRPVKTKAKKSISAFKIREGMTVGASVTLRGAYMYYFVDKLINIALPRVRDFRGINPTSVDKNGNLTIGFKEHIVFPEIEHDAVERVHGLEATIITTATTAKEGRVLLAKLGIPFKKQ